MQPKLAVITVTSCHLIPVICARRELADLEHDRAVGGGQLLRRVRRGALVIKPEYQSLDNSSGLLNLCASFRVGAAPLASNTKSLTPQQYT